MRPSNLSVYHSFIESLLTFSFICWFYGLSVREKNCLSSIIKVCSKIIGIQLTDSLTSSIWKKQVIQKARKVISHPDHILGQEFCLMPSGRRYQLHIQPPAPLSSLLPKKKQNNGTVCPRGRLDALKSDHLSLS